MSGTIWINGCEASGDMHGASLMAALRERRPGLAFSGIGGPAMAAAGQVQAYTMEALSLVGLTEVFTSLPRILSMFRDIRKRFAAERPEAVILIDAPDFNFRLAGMAHDLGIPVYYYISPQVWAWRSGRVKFLRKHCRKVLCILPFEKDFYAARGMDVEFVGHPLLDALPLTVLEGVERDPRRIGILPGSRRKEITRHLPVFGRAAARLFAAHPDLRFTLVRAPGVKAETLSALWPSGVPVTQVGPEERYRAMGSCAFLLASSGTATLEAALLGAPCLVAYRMSFVTALLGWMLIESEFISLPNLILGREVFPERIQYKATAKALAALAQVWLTDGAGLDAVRGELALLRLRMGEPGAAGRAAALILDSLA